MDGITPEAREYVSAAIAEMQLHGVRIDIAAADAAGFGGGGRLGGYFDEDGPTFFVAPAITPMVWLSVFLHEYQHFRQWIGNSPTWAAKLGDDCCAWYVFDAWLQGVVELTPQRRDEAIRIILECEIECERMTLAEIKAKPDLGITPEWYTRAANVYLAFYGAVRLMRQWYQHSPYADDSLVSLMPDDRLLTLEESLRPSPAVVGAIVGKVFSEVA